MNIKTLAAELVFLRDTELAQLADYLVANYPNTADRLEADISFSFKNQQLSKAEEVYSPYLGA